MDLYKTMQTKERDDWKLIDCKTELHNLEEEEEEDEDDGEEGKNNIQPALLSPSTFKFPPPPRLPILSASRRKCESSCQSVSDDTETNSDSQSDQASKNRKRSMPIPIPSCNKNHSSGNATTSSSSGSNNHHRSNNRGYQSDGSPVRNLPPIGVFWDIENCQIPRGKSAISVAQAIRDKFFAGYREAEFVVVCDVKKETALVVKELNDAQINLIHVDATCKNAADEKLRQSMRRFADTHGSSACIVLISGDVNFVPDLCDLRHRKKIHVILLHLDNCNTNLILCANEHYSYSELTEKLPYRTTTKPTNQLFELVVSNLPVNCDPLKIRGRLKRLAENCGGRVGHIIGLTSTVRFPTLEYALRAKKRMEGEKVFGNAITLGYPRALPIDSTTTTTHTTIVKVTSPSKPRFNIQRRKMDEGSKLYSQFQPAPGVPPTTTILQYMGPATHQNMPNQWQAQQIIHRAPLFSFYGTGGGPIMQYPHISQQPHISAMPTIIHTHAATCTSSQANMLDVFNCTNSIPSTSTARTGTALISSTSGMNSGPFNQQSNLWNYNQLPNPVGPANLAAASANVHHVLSNLSLQNNVSPASQNQFGRGRPILGTRNVIAAETQMPQLDLRKSYSQVLNEIDKKQLQTEGIMQWLSKSSNNASNSDAQNENCERNKIDQTSSSTNGDLLKSTVSSMPSKTNGGIFSKINAVNHQSRSSSTSSSLLGMNVPNHDNGSSIYSKQPRQKTSNGCNNSVDLNGGNSTNVWSQNKVGSSSSTSNRKCRTPSPYMLSGMKLSVPPSIVTTSQQSNSHSDSENMFNPISSGLLTSTSGGGVSSGNNSNGPVELLVSNLDQSIDSIEMKKLLMNAFQEHVMVLHISMFAQSGGSLSAVVKVPTLQDAQFAISQLHRKKIGYKRITISHARSTSPHNPQVIRSQVVAILLEVPGHQLPLFKFRELFESRYLKPISASDLNRLRDVCDVTEGVEMRTISLNKDYYKSCSSPQLMSSSNQDNDNGIQAPQSQQQVGFLVCSIHAGVFQLSNGKGWAEQETPGLPCIRVALAEFSSRIHALINSHNNLLPLTSLCDCYEAEFGVLMRDENGVPLEHLVTCVSGVELQFGDSLAKYLRMAPKNCQTEDEKKDDVFKSGTVSPSLINNFHAFSKELVDLLKSQPHCVLSVNKFIPAYHHHFRRQCRVADYGFTRLIDVFEAMPNIVQLMGEGNKRMLTLTHRSQMRRFTIDLLRILKLQSSKQVNINELPGMFERYHGKAFDPVDYGLCYLTDLLSQLTENTVVITNSGCDSFIAIPKREQTPKEIDKTKVFAQEVVGLLGHCPQYSLLFERFIPAYHHHYGHQCRVSDFGFTKLIELFEAIPHIVTIEDIDGERRVTLTNEEKLKVLGEQVSDLVNGCYPPGLLLSALPAVFLRQYGYALKTSTYDCESLKQLIAKLNATVKLVELESGVTIVPVEQMQLQSLALRVWRILMETSTGKMPLIEFDKAYFKIYKQNFNFENVKTDLTGCVKINQDKSGEIVIQLTALQLFARDVYRLLYSSDGKLAINSFETAYLRRFDTAVQPSRYGYTNLVSLLQAIPHVVVLRGKGAKRLILLNKLLTTAGVNLPSGFIKNVSNVAANNCAGTAEHKVPCGSSSCKISKTEWPFPNSPSPYEIMLKDFLNPIGKGESNPTGKGESSDINVTPPPNDIEESNVLKTPEFKRTGWNIKDNSSEQNDIVVHLPKFNTPPPMPSSLISPCKYLMPSTIASHLEYHAPHPSQLPKVFLFKNDENGSNNETEDVSSSTIKHDAPQNDFRDSEGSCSGSDGGTPKNGSVKRKFRLAAQFHTPMELKY